MRILAHCKSLEERRAFMMGYAFALGCKYAKSYTTDAIPRKYIIFRRAKNKTIAINKKTHEVSGVLEDITKAKKSIPDFNAFVENNPKLKNKNTAKVATTYLLKFYKNKTIDKPKGLNNCDKLIFTSKGLKETGSKINQDKLKILPYLEYIYKTGHEVGQADNYHNPNSNVKFHYTQKIVKLKNEIFRVTLAAKQVGKNAVFSHYMVDKADK